MRSRGWSSSRRHETYITKDKLLSALMQLLVRRRSRQSTSVVLPLQEHLPLLSVRAGTHELLHPLSPGTPPEHPPTRAPSPCYGVGCRRRRRGDATEGVGSTPMAGSCWRVRASPSSTRWGAGTPEHQLRPKNTTASPSAQPL